MGAAALATELREADPSLSVQASIAEANAATEGQRHKAAGDAISKGKNDAARKNRLAGIAKVGRHNTTVPYKSYEELEDAMVYLCSPSTSVLVESEYRKHRAVIESDACSIDILSMFSLKDTSKTQSSPVCLEGLCRRFGIKPFEIRGEGKQGAAKRIKEFLRDAAIAR